MRDITQIRNLKGMRKLANGKFEMEPEDLRPPVDLKGVLIPADLNERVDSFCKSLPARTANGQGSDGSSRSHVITKFLESVVPAVPKSSAKPPSESAKADHRGKEGVLKNG